MSERPTPEVATVAVPSTISAVIGVEAETPSEPGAGVTSPTYGPKGAVLAEFT